jgi:hypothetical protein
MTAFIRALAALDGWRPWRADFEASTAREWHPADRLR